MVTQPAAADAGRAPGRLVLFRGAPAHSVRRHGSPGAGLPRHGGLLPWRPRPRPLARPICRHEGRPRGSGWVRGGGRACAQTSCLLRLRMRKPPPATAASRATRAKRFIAYLHDANEGYTEHSHTYGRPRSAQPRAGGRAEAHRADSRTEDRLSAEPEHATSVATSAVGSLGCRSSYGAIFSLFKRSSHSPARGTVVVAPAPAGPVSARGTRHEARGTRHEARGTIRPP